MLEDAFGRLLPSLRGKIPWEILIKTRSAFCTLLKVSVLQHRESTCSPKRRQGGRSGDPTKTPLSYEKPSWKTKYPTAKRSEPVVLNLGWFAPRGLGAKSGFICACHSGGEAEWWHLVGIIEPFKLKFVRVYFKSILRLTWKGAGKKLCTDISSE